MMNVIQILVGLGFIIAGAAGRWYGLEAAAPMALPLMVVGAVMIGALLLRQTYYRSEAPWPDDDDQPRALRFSWVDHLKLAIGWFDAFRRNYAVAPGLYYTGESYDRDAPLLVTSNYLMTVLLVARHARAFNARLLVIDTDGINVWCAAGKGRFANAEILRQLRRYDRELLAAPDSKWLPLVLPKLGLSGVDLRALQREKIRAVIGPVYARELPTFLSRAPLKDRVDDRVRYGLWSRLFSMLPGMLQHLRFSFLALAVLLAASVLVGSSVPFWGMVGLTAALAAAYPILYPWLPGRRFGVKGLWLGALAAATLGVLAQAAQLDTAQLVMGGLFAMATALFVGLAFTGNSAVSNYSRVRQEIARFLPINVLLFLGSLAAFVITEVQR